MTKHKAAEPCLSGKVCYATRGAAEQVRVYNGGHGRVYRCECGTYHLTYHLTSSAHRGTARGRERAKQRQRQWRV